MLSYKKYMEGLVDVFLEGWVVEGGRVLFDDI